MQRLLIHINSRKSRLFRFILANYKYLLIKENSFHNVNSLTFRRYYVNESSGSKIGNIHTSQYKSPIAEQEQCESNDLQSSRLSKVRPTGSTHDGNEAVCSCSTPCNSERANPGDKTSKACISMSNTIVKQNLHKTKGGTEESQSIDIVNSLDTSASRSTSTIGTISPNTPLDSSLTKEAVFTPNISSTYIYSELSASSKMNFDTAEERKIRHETIDQLTATSTQETAALTQNLSKEYPPHNKTSDTNVAPILHESDMRDQILRESLSFVHEHGWSMETIRAGIRKCNQPRTSEALFYNGYDLVEFFMRDSNAKMSEFINETVLKGEIEGTSLLLEGLKYRLKLVIPYADVWEQALAQKGFPPNAKRAWKSLLDLANSALLGIGDTSTDMKWYTKRISIATIYRSAEIYMLQDGSPNKIETMHFLERHLIDFQTTGSRPSVTQSLSDTAQVASGLLTVVRTMTQRHK